MSPQNFLPNLSTDGQENATFEAKNTNPHAAIPRPANNGVFDHHRVSNVSLILDGLHLGLVPVLHVVRVVRHLFDHLLQEVVAREHRVQLALPVGFLK